MTLALVLAGVFALTAAVVGFRNAVNTNVSTSQTLIQKLSATTTSSLPKFDGWKFSHSLRPVTFTSPGGNDVTVIWSVDQAGPWSTDVQHMAVLLDCGGRVPRFSLAPSRGSAGAWKFGASPVPFSPETLESLARHRRWFSLHGEGNHLLWVERRPDDGARLEHVGPMLESILEARLSLEDDSRLNGEARAEYASILGTSPEPSKPWLWVERGATAAAVLMVLIAARF